MLGCDNEDGEVVDQAAKERSNVTTCREDRL